MKKILLPVLVSFFAIVVISSCKKTVKALFPETPADLPEVSYTIQALDSIRISGFPVTEIPLHTPFNLPTYPQHLNIDSIVRLKTGNVFGAGDITSIKVKQFVLKITQYGDSSNNIANFESASFKFSSNTKPDAIQVASVNFPDAFSLQSIINGDGTPELRPYLDGSELYYDITASLRRHTKKKLKISILATITMK